MKKFFGEFKKFITRGNVLDMAVGVIVGGAFTAIVNALSNNILKPIINFLLALIFGANSLEGIFTFLKKAYVEENVPASGIDLTKSIYIDWGAFINAIINFLLIAIVLFLIIKTINKLNERGESFTKKLKESFYKEKPSRAERKQLKALGINVKDKKAVNEWREKVKAEKLALEEQEKAKKLAEEQEAKRHTTEGLLEDIKKLLEKKS